MPPAGYEPFLAEILARPEEDAPRLVYADWLEEQGDPRAEFIRLQCQLAARGRLDPAYEHLCDRSSATLNEFGELWRAELPAWARAGCEFRRGFVERVAVWSREHFPYLGELWQYAPIQTLALHDFAGAMPQFVETGVLNWLPNLELLDSRAGFQELRDLLRLTDEDQDGKPDALGIRRLAILGLEIRDAALVFLANKAELPELRTLEMLRCSMTDRGLSLFADTSRLPKMNWLDLSENELGDPGASFLANASNRRNLEQLHLREAGITDEGVRYLAEATFADNLLVLNLSGNRLSDESAFVLAERFPTLQRLVVRNCFFTPRGMLRLHEQFGARVQVR